MSDKCLHRHIKIITTSRYIVDIGWEALQEQYDIDMAEYFIEQERDRIVCGDCAKVLDR